MFELARKMRARHEKYARGGRAEVGDFIVQLLIYVVAAAILIGGSILLGQSIRSSSADSNARSDVQANVSMIEQFRTTHDDNLPTAAEFGEMEVFATSSGAAFVNYVEGTGGTYCVSATWDPDKYGAASADEGQFHLDTRTATSTDGKVARGTC